MVADPGRRFFGDAGEQQDRDDSHGTSPENTRGRPAEGGGDHDPPKADTTKARLK
ncbi:hypothetical protein ACFQH2_00370 [Natronoarchaeum sp. GCM10025703]|uniref:hypothetical protein n=1 Tax=Natronoarchaeum sp. GCM10025703 TaxID=3252685 RepID=UPI00360695A9